MRIVRVALAFAVVVAAAALLVSGGSGDDPRTPAALPGSPPPFLGTAVSGDGGLTAAVDAYGDVVDLRAPGPAGSALIENPAPRQAAGTVPAATGIVPRVAVGGGPPLPLWRAESVTQGYLRGTNVARTVGRVKGARLVVLTAAAGRSLAVRLTSMPSGEASASPAISVHTEPGVHCAQAQRTGVLDLLCRVGRALPPAGGASPDLSGECDAVIRGAVRAGRRWSRRSRDLGAGAPPWARRIYRRSLLSVHALTSRATGAAAAGARDGWAYVWPRDAATAALALAASGHRAEARHVARFLAGLDLGAAARFDEGGAPVLGRAAQGDAAGWVDAAAAAAGIPARRRLAWRGAADYQESSRGTYLGNALAAAAVETLPRAPLVDGPKTGHMGRFSARQHSGAAELARILREFGTDRGLVRRAGDPGSGLDSAAGWAVRPFRLTALFPAAERTLLQLTRRATLYGITPGEGWDGGEDPWMAPTAWSAWALAALADEAEASRADRRGPLSHELRGGSFGTPSARPTHEVRQEVHSDRLEHELPREVSPGKARELRHEALALLADLRRAATPAGDLPERVGGRTGIPTSTTPLLWSSALTVLALRELWP